jgi:hypothetical protein
MSWEERMTADDTRRISFRPGTVVVAKDGTWFVVTCEGIYGGLCFWSSANGSLEDSTNDFPKRLIEYWRVIEP